MTRSILSLSLCLALAILAGCDKETARRRPVGPTPLPPPPPPIDVRPVDPRFNDQFWQQLVFDVFDDSRYGWDQITVIDRPAVMRLYIATTTPAGRRVLFGGVGSRR